MMTIKNITGLYTIVDNSYCPDIAPGQLALKYLEGGAQILQLRQKGEHPDDIAWSAEDILTLKKNHPFTFIINDDPNLAKKLGADGVHLGQNDMEVSHARDILGSDKIIGKSTHSLDEVSNAVSEPVDYISLGAIFPTSTKGPDHPLVGLDLLKEVVQFAKIPVVAIGGINRATVDDVLKTGVASVAMISALLEAEDIVEETKYFVDLFQNKSSL